MSNHCGLICRAVVKHLLAGVMNLLTCNLSQYYQKFRIHTFSYFCLVSTRLCLIVSSIVQNVFLFNIEVISVCASFLCSSSSKSCFMWPIFMNWKCSVTKMFWIVALQHLVGCWLCTEVPLDCTAYFAQLVLRCPWHWTQIMSPCILPLNFSVNDHMYCILFWWFSGYFTPGYTAFVNQELTRLSSQQ